MKKFDKWNFQKKVINDNTPKVFFKERDIFFIKLGKNVGDEQDGKGQKFKRPVVILRKFNNNLFIGVPLTSNLNKNSIFYFKFNLGKKENNAILSQIRIIDSRRLVNKIGMISKNDFNLMKQKISKLLKLTDFNS